MLNTLPPGTELGGWRDSEAGELARDVVTGRLIPLTVDDGVLRTVRLLGWAHSGDPVEAIGRWLL